MNGAGIGQASGWYIGRARRRLRRGGVIAVAVLALGWLPSLVGRASVAAAATCTDTWIGGAGAWEDPTNWSNGVPSAADAVCLNAGASVVAGSTVPAAAGSITGAIGSDLSVTGFTLTLADATTTSVIGGLQVDRDGIVGPGSIEIPNGGTWVWAGGTLRGAGTVTIDAGATATLALDPRSNQSAMTIESYRPIVNHGSLHFVNHSAGTCTSSTAVALSAAGVPGELGGSLDSDGSVSIEAGGCEVIVGRLNTGDPVVHLAPGTVGSVTGGHIGFVKGAAQFAGTWTVAGSSTLEVGQVNGFTDMPATVDVASGSTFTFSGATPHLTGSVSGPGQVCVEMSNVLLDNPGALAGVSAVNLSDCGLSGQGSGSLTVARGATATVQRLRTQAPSVIMGGGTVEVVGDGSPATEDLTIDGAPAGGLTVNDATVTLAHGATGSIGNIGTTQLLTPPASAPATAESALVNHGTLAWHKATVTAQPRARFENAADGVVVADTGVTDATGPEGGMYGQFGRFLNAGRIDVQSGAFRVEDYAGPAVDIGGTIEVHPGATLNPVSPVLTGTVTLDAATASAPGGVLQSDNDITNAGTLNLAPGSLFTSATRFIQTPAGRLHVDLATPATTGHVTATNDASLAGALDVATATSFVPTTAPFDVVRASSVTGTFGAFTATPLTGGTLAPVYGPTSASVVASFTGPLVTVIDDTTPQSVLDALTSVPGDLVVHLTSGTTLSLPNLTSIGGNLVITGDLALTSVAAPSLASVGGTVTVTGNPALTSIDLSGLTTVAGVAADAVSVHTTAGSLALTIGTAGAVVTTIAAGDVTLTAAGAGGVTVTGPTGNLAVTTTGAGSLSLVAATVGGSLTIDAGGNVTLSADTTVAANEHIKAAGTIAVPAVIVGNGSSSVVVSTGSGTVNVGAITTNGTGTVDVTGSGTVNVGPVSSAGGVVVSSGSTGSVNVNGPPPGSVVVSNGSGTVNVNGPVSSTGDVVVSTGSSTVNVNGPVSSTSGDITLTSSAGGTTQINGPVFAPGGTVVVTAGGSSLLVGGPTSSVLASAGTSSVVVGGTSGSVSVTTGSGSVVVGGTSGSVSVSNGSGSGSVVVGGTSGSVSVSNGSGSVVVSGTSGSVSVSGGSGSVVVGGTTGSINTTVSGGSGSIVVGGATGAIDVSGTASSGASIVVSGSSTGSAIVGGTGTGTGTPGTVAVTGTTAPGDVVVTGSPTSVTLTGNTIGGTTAVSTSGPATVNGTTTTGPTTVTTVNGVATMSATLPSGAFTSPVGFAMTPVPASSTAISGTGPSGQPVSATPVTQEQFAFAIPTLSAAATLSFDVNVGALDPSTQASFLAAVAAGRATIGVIGDAAGATLQTFVACDATQVPSANGCVSVTPLDAGGIALPAGSSTTPTTVRFTGIVGHFSTWGVYVVQPPTLASITVKPAGAAVPAGLTQSYTATGVWSDGTTADLTSVVTWAVNGAGSVAIISPTGLLTAVAPGSATVTATSGTVSGSVPVTVSAPVLTSIAVTPAAASLPAGLTQPFVATGTYSDGSAADLTASVVWSASPGAVGSINASGVATTLAPGTLTVTATSGATTGSAVLTVTPATLTSLSVAPVTVSVPKGATTAFTAIGAYSDGSSRDVTAAATWTTGSAAVATIAAGGVATAAGVGTTSVTAMLGAVHASAGLTVTAVTLASVTVTPAPLSLPKGLSAPLTATAHYSDGSIADVTRAAVWTSASPTVVSVTSGATSRGLVRALKLGSTTVTATFGGKKGTDTVTVTAAVPVALRIVPRLADVGRGRSVAFYAVDVYSDGTRKNVTALVAWSVLDRTIVSQNGNVFTGVAPGRTTVTATMGDRRASATIVVER